VSLLRALRLKSNIPASELLMGLTLFAATSLSILFTRVPGGIALFWPGSAIAAAWLIRLERVRWLAATTAVMSAFFLSNALVAHRPWATAADFTAVNVLEIGSTVLAFRCVWRFSYPQISIDQAAFMTAILGIAIPGMAAALGGLLLHVQFGSAWSTGTLQWWSAHTIGACLVGPVIILASVQGLKKLARPAYVVQNALTWLGSMVACYLMFRHVRFPFVSMGLLLIVAAFRLGGFGASLMSLSLGLLITSLWALGIRPLGLDSELYAQGTLLGLPIIALLMTVIPPIAVGLGSDARRATAKALRTSERRFRESMEHSPIGMVIADLNGRWRYTNLALQQMLGYTAAELERMPPGGPSRSDEQSTVESRWSHLLSGELKVCNATQAFRHGDGRLVWTHMAVSLLRDDEGAPLHFIAQIESLQARQQAEETLAAERERLRITLASINDAVITTDADTRITYVNAAAEALLATQMPAIVGRRVDEVMHLVDPETSKTATNMVGQSAYHGRVLKREKPCLLHRPDGSMCYIMDVISPVLAETGVLTGLVIVLKDATQDVERGRDLEHRALHDPLTGLSNRADFNERLQAIFRRATATDSPAAVIAIDLDRFKAVNDSAGHAAGDAVLCKVADACRSLVRTSDTVARLGGDEFSVILHDCGEERATRIANRILQVLNPVSIEWGNTSYLVNASLGLAMVTPSMTDAKAWIGAADAACYAAKHQGRARLQLAT
jgi:diguanylate cyclase (GGDEF)-like protein/PAS domain S-box-containing protein